ncbi:hypothetical protein [Bartonella sp. cb54]|uniref:hypothetical protein n=3 Tax=unclassified Bartonella TaxID=2645622 RepID=UPI0039A61244
MKVVITKPMCVLGDNKDIVRFEPSTPDNPFVETSHAVYSRLKRANAVRLCQEQFDEQKEETKIGEQENTEIIVSDTDAAEKLDEQKEDTEINGKEERETTVSEKSNVVKDSKSSKVVKASKPSTDSTKKA